MTDANDDELAKLLGNAGAKMEPNNDKMSGARSAFMTAWEADFAKQESAGQVSVDQESADHERTEPKESGDKTSAKVVSINQARKISRSWQIGSSIAAAILLSAIVFVFTGQDGVVSLPEKTERVAILESMKGHVQANGVVLAAGGLSKARFQTGVEIETGDASYLRAKLANNASLRVDQNTLLVLTDDGLDLLYGRVYIDAPDGASPTSIRVDDLVVTDIGTQFEVAREKGQADTVQVGVREGEVEVSDVEASSEKEGQSNKIVSVKAQTGSATKLLIEDGELVSETELDSNDTYWNWVHESDYELELETVAQLLELVAREFGLQLEYSSQAVMMASKTTSLSGSIRIDETLPSQLPELLSTANFQRLDAAEGTLLVDFRR